jgi:hypothetical protein
MSNTKDGGKPVKKDLPYDPPRARKANPTPAPVSAVRTAALAEHKVRH